MRLGVREICEVVLRAKATQKVGNKTFFKDEPVIYFDSLKTSSLEGAATTVYATGGRGNSRLIAWEGERTLTFNMEDALISPISFAILSGAGLMDATEAKPIYVHTTETTDDVKVEADKVTVFLAEKPYVADDGNYIYVMPLTEGEITTEPYVPTVNAVKPYNASGNEIMPGEDGVFEDGALNEARWGIEITAAFAGYLGTGENTVVAGANELKEFGAEGEGKIAVLVDYYVERTSGAQQIDIEPDKFGGNYYLEASTLFRDQATGQDLPAEFIIPNCKVQSNFTFTMAATGDPSTFNFVLDAFPDYTRFNKTKKVLACLQIIEPDLSVESKLRNGTAYIG